MIVMHRYRLEEWARATGVRAFAVLQLLLSASNRLVLMCGEGMESGHRIASTTVTASHYRTWVLVLIGVEIGGATMLCFARSRLTAQLLLLTGGVASTLAVAWTMLPMLTWMSPGAGFLQAENWATCVIAGSLLHLAVHRSEGAA